MAPSSRPCERKAESACGELCPESGLRDLHGAHVAARACVSVAVEGARSPALISNGADVRIAAIDRRTSFERRAGERDPAIGGEAIELWIRHDLVRRMVERAVAGGSVAQVVAEGR